MKDLVLPSQSVPALYSLRNCPYAMRARIAIFKSKQKIELRDVILTNKPPQMIAASAKATVPIVELGSGEVIDESIDIMLWALRESDPYGLLMPDNKSALADMLALIRVFDTEFKVAIEAYKCAKRYHEDNLIECRHACEQFVALLEERLRSHTYLMADNETLLDIALLPFIRQFSRIERQWYLQSPYVKVRQWLNNYLQSPMFTKVMAKYPLWSQGSVPTYFGDYK